MTSSFGSDEPSPYFLFSHDIQNILHTMNRSHRIKHCDIQEHFKNIASNPKPSYAEKEQIAVLIEIMKCYNTQIHEYQKSMCELMTIIETIENTKSSSSIVSEVDKPNTDPLIPSSSISLYEYFMQIIWGTQQSNPDTLKKSSVIPIFTCNDKVSRATPPIPTFVGESDVISIETIDLGDIYEETPPAKMTNLRDILTQPSMNMQNTENKAIDTSTWPKTVPKRRATIQPVHRDIYMPRK